MRIAVLATIGGLALGTMALAHAADGTQTVRHHQHSYRNAAVAGRPQLDVRGTLVPVDAQSGADQFVLRTDQGRVLSVSLDAVDAGTLPDEPSAFSGSLALGPSVTGRLARRGLRPAARAHLHSGTSDARTAQDVAAAQPTALPVSNAVITEPAQTQAATDTSTHRMYVAVITNRGSVEESDETIDSEVDTIMNYWTTEAGSRFTSFTRPSAITRYASSVAPSEADGCGLSSPGAVWDEAEGKFPGVSFSSRSGNHLMVLVADECNGVGIGTVGSSLASGGETVVSLGRNTVAVGEHEIGHNLSLHHANAETCATTCTTDEYWDLYSIMGLVVTGGTWTPPSLDTAYRVQLGLADAAEAPEVRTSQTVHLAGRGNDGDTRGVVVTDPAGGAQYVIDYRSGTGRDGTAFYTRGATVGSTFSYRTGVTVDRVEKDKSLTTLTHRVGSRYATSLVAGESLTFGSVRVTVASAVPAAGADVVITLPGSTATPAPAPSSTPTATPPTTAPPTTLPPTTAPPALRFTALRAPQIYGTARVGVRILASAGSWSPIPAAISYQWFAGAAAIARASGPSFTPSAAQLGLSIRVRVTASRSGYPSASAVSAATAAVSAGRLPRAQARVRGNARVGRTLTAEAPAWRTGAVLAYRWYANGRAVKAATHARLTVPRALRGKRLSVRVSARRTGYQPATATSGRTSPVR